MNRLINKKAVITGGSSGVGLATAKEFTDEGARVIITGKDPASLEKAEQELGQNASAVVGDSADMSSVMALQQRVATIFPSIDILFVNAGVSKFHPIGDVTEAIFDNLFDTNFKGAYFTIQQLLPLFQTGGSIILNASLNAHIGRATASLYGATKGALLTLAKNLSSELIHRKIRVNTISPGPIDTPLQVRKDDNAEEALARRNRRCSKTPSVDSAHRRRSPGWLPSLHPMKRRIFWASTSSRIAECLYNQPSPHKTIRDRRHPQ